jgi:NAD(P)-dependent dehydrogenase (short-subunit alcohol dehydrogenase family)
MKKVIAITGASGKIGFALAQILAKKNYNLLFQSLLNYIKLSKYIIKVK